MPSNIESNLKSTTVEISLLLALKSAGQTVFNHSVGLLDKGIGGLIKGCSEGLSTIILQTIRKTGEGIAYCTNIDHNPQMTSLLPIMLAAGTGAYAYYQLHDAFYKPTPEGTPPRKWIVLGKRPPSNQKGIPVTAFNFTKTNNVIGFKDISLLGQDITWWNIPCSKTRFGFVDKEIGNTATRLLKGAIAAALTFNLGFGGIGRALELNLANSGPFGLTMAVTSALPNYIAYFAGRLLASTNVSLVKAGLAGGFTIGALYVWSTIKLSGAEHGLFDWEQKGWDKLDKKVATWATIKVLAGSMLLFAAVGELREVLPGLDDL